MNESILEELCKNELTCPECGNKQLVEMSEEEDNHVYSCNACFEVIQSNEDECCVYCQYGEVKCTMEQVRWN
jgi:hypothetical protein